MQAVVAAFVASPGAAPGSVETWFPARNRWRLDSPMQVCGACGGNLVSSQRELPGGLVSGSRTERWRARRAAVGNQLSMLDTSRRRQPQAATASDAVAVETWFPRGNRWRSDSPMRGCGTRDGNQVSTFDTSRRRHPVGPTQAPTAPDTVAVETWFPRGGKIASGITPLPSPVPATRPRRTAPRCRRMRRRRPPRACRSWQIPRTSAHRRPSRTPLPCCS